MPASLAHKQYEKYEKYEKSDAQTDYIEFPGRPHLMMVGEGWEEIAARIEDWIDGVLQKSPASTHEVSAPGLGIGVSKLASVHHSVTCRPPACAPGTREAATIV